MLDLLHFLHIAGATVFVGAAVFFDWVVGGALARMTVEDRRRTALALRPFTGPLLIGSLAVTLLAGLARLWMSGALQAWADVTSPYAGRALLALLVVVGSEALAGPIRRKMRAGIEALDDQAYLTQWKRQRALNTVVLIVVLLLMVSMRLGW